jgi:hypothetical protein
MPACAGMTIGHDFPSCPRRRVSRIYIVNWVICIPQNRESKPTIKLMNTMQSKTCRPTKPGQASAAVSRPKNHICDHIRIERRSIALHRAIAERIRQNPALMDKARENLEKYHDQFLRENRPLPKALSEWRDILTNQPLETVMAFLVSFDESAVRLRQSSPFAGVLTPKERWKIYETYRPGTYYPSGGQHHPRR